MTIRWSDEHPVPPVHESEWHEYMRRALEAMPPAGPQVWSTAHAKLAERISGASVLLAGTIYDADDEVTSTVTADEDSTSVTITVRRRPAGRPKGE